MRTQRFIAFVWTVCLIWLVAGAVMADDGGGDQNALLKGKYRFSVNKNCADVSEGFNLPDPYPPDNLNFSPSARGFGYAPNLYITGINIFDGRGHITARERGTLVSPATLQAPYFQGAFAVAVFEETCEWTYRVNRNGKFTAGGSCEATDHSYKVSGFKVEGQVDDRGSVVSYGAAVPPVLETLEFFDPNGTLVGSTKRLCGGTGSMVRIPE